jgi:nucleotide-binding universal stress UspA family protein
MDMIIVGVDQSETARRAAFTAAKLASACGKPLHIVMAVSRRRTVDLAVGSTDRWHLDSVSIAE